MASSYTIAGGPLFTTEGVETWEGDDGGVLDDVAFFGFVSVPFFFPGRCDVEGAVLSLVKRFPGFEARGFRGV